MRGKEGVRELNTMNSKAAEALSAPKFCAAWSFVLRFLSRQNLIFLFPFKKFIFFNPSCSIILVQKDAVGIILLSGIRLWVKTKLTIQWQIYKKHFIWKHRYIFWWNCFSCVTNTWFGCFWRKRICVGNKLGLIMRTYCINLRYRNLHALESRGIVPGKL